MIRSLALVLSVVLAGCADTPGGFDPRYIGKDFYAGHFEPNTNADALTNKARDTCGTADQCMVFGWTDPSKQARGFPMTDREAQSLAFQYTINRLNGTEETRFRCGQVTGAKKADCM